MRLVTSRVKVLSVCFLLGGAASLVAAKMKFTVNIEVPSIEEDGTILLDDDSGNAAMKGAINTKNGQVRATFKGTTGNLSGTSQSYNNPPQVEGILQVQLPELDVQQNKYKVSKPKNNVSKCRGSVRGVVMN